VPAPNLPLSGARPTDPDLGVLHVLRLKSVASVEAVAAVVGVDEDVVREQLQVAADRRWARHRDGALSGWSLTPAGRVEDIRRLGEQLEQTGARGAVEDAYRRFLEINPVLLQVCTDWQLVPSDGTTPVRNEHLDAAYDDAVLDRLQAVDTRAQPICADLAAALDRFSAYGPRLAAALERTRAGDRQWLDRPVIDSYHTVWFELHEDLLATLGRERSQERSA
jgi:hypothetical protein